MSEQLDLVDARLQRIEERLAALERRLTALELPPEAGQIAAAAPEEDHAPAVGAPVGAGEGFDVGGILSLLGRTFIVFGGAYLLRALMESESLPKGVAVALGFAYALLWLAAADRAAAGQRFTSSLFHGVTSVVIAFPLLWEASTRFGFFGATATAAMVGLFTGLALLVAWRQSLQGLAAATTAAALVTVLALAAERGQVIELAAFLVLLGIGTLWISYDRDWHWLRWPPALMADAFAAALIARALQQPPLERPEAVMALQLFLVAAYLSSFAARTIVRGRVVIPFEVLQTACALAIGLGGALAVAHGIGTAGIALGVASTLLGAGCYAVAFLFLDRQRDLDTNFYFYVTLALLLLLTGGGVLLPRPALSLVLAALAIAAFLLGLRFAHLTLTLQGGIYGLAATIVSGLLASAASSLVATPPEPAAALALPPLTVLAALLLCLAVPAVSRPPPLVATATRLVVAALALTGGAGLLVAALAPLLAGAPPNAGVLATVRTAVLTAAAVLVAGASRTERYLDLGGLLYPVLVLAGVKLLVEDLRVSRPATLFLALALYGSALVAAARLARRAPPKATDGLR